MICRVVYHKLGVFEKVGIRERVEGRGDVSYMRRGLVENGECSALGVTKVKVIPPSNTFLISKSLALVIHICVFYPYLHHHRPTSREETSLTPPSTLLSLSFQAPSKKSPLPPPHTIDNPSPSQPQSPPYLPQTLAHSRTIYSPEHCEHAVVEELRLRILIHQPQGWVRGEIWGSGGLLVGGGMEGWT